MIWPFVAPTELDKHVTENLTQKMGKMLRKFPLKFGI